MSSRDLPAVQTARPLGRRSFLRGMAGSAVVVSVSTSPLSACGLDSETRNVVIASINILVGLLKVFVPIIFQIATANRYRAHTKSHIELDVYLLAVDGVEGASEATPVQVSRSMLHGTLEPGETMGEFIADEESFVPSEPGTYMVRADCWNADKGDWDVLYTDRFVVEA